MARKASSAIGASEYTIQDTLGCSKARMVSTINIIHAFQYRHYTYPKFGVNRSEMWALLALNGVLELRDKVILSRKTLIDFLSGSFKQRTKLIGYYNGLQRKGCIGSFEYISNPGSLSYGITDYGFQIINAYYDDMNTFYSRYMNERPATKQVKPYVLLDQETRSVSISENIPKYHRPRQAA